jgi:hypothetical protein
MDQKKLFTIIGAVFLLLYLTAAALWILNFQTGVQTVNTEQLKSI